MNPELRTFQELSPSLTMSSPQAYAELLPARAAYSHCASVGREYSHSFGRRPAACSFRVIFSQKARICDLPTDSTGKEVPEKLLGFSPITDKYFSWVTGYLPSQNPCEMVTGVPANPIWKVPGGHQQKPLRSSPGLEPSNESVDGLWLPLTMAATVTLLSITPQAFC